MIFPQFIDAATGERGAIFVEHGRVGVPESINRLVNIADREQALPDQVDQNPLQPIGVLQLIEQNFFKSFHRFAPDGRVGFEQPDGFFFKIREIERSLFALLFPIALIQTRDRRPQHLEHRRVRDAQPVRFHALQ